MNSDQLTHAHNRYLLLELFKNHRRTVELKVLGYLYNIAINIAINTCLVLTTICTGNCLFKFISLKFRSNNINQKNFLFYKEKEVTCKIYYPQHIRVTYIHNFY